jgi:predicted Zn finger-like uncharacterized protein
MTLPVYHTRCPECRTIFRVTPAQLAARDGLVRCGICASAFRADQHLFDSLSPEDPAPPPRNARLHDSGLPPSRGPSASRYVGTTAGPPEPLAATAWPDIPADDLPLMNEFPQAPNRRRVPTTVWLAGSLLLVLLLLAQAAYFFAAELARDARLRPWLALYCEQLACDLHAPGGAAAIDLTQTAVAPHPRYENALRLRAVLVNRTNVVQPYPLMEVSLTDSAGHVLARRRFTAAQYLESPPAGGDLAPAVSVATRLDVTNADGRAVGYEIRLVAAPER